MFRPSSGVVDVTFSKYVLPLWMQASLPHSIDKGLMQPRHMNAGLIPHGRMEALCRTKFGSPAVSLKIPSLLAMLMVLGSDQLILPQLLPYNVQLADVPDSFSVDEYRSYNPML